MSVTICLNPLADRLAGHRVERPADLTKPLGVVGVRASLDELVVRVVVRTGG
jgi:hypothetical protein